MTLPAVAKVELRDWGKCGKRYFAWYAEPQPRKGGRPKEGFWMARTTTLLNSISKPALPLWYANCACQHWLENILPGQSYTEDQLQIIGAEAKVRAEKERDAAASLGSSVHNAIQYRLERNEWPAWLLDAAPEVGHAVGCWAEWWETAGLTAVEVELTVACVSLGYAGTLDCLAWDKEGNSVLCDWKTSKSLYPEHLWQVAAYATALQDHGRPLPDKAFIVRLPKNLDEPRAKFVCAWDEPERRQKLITGWRTFVRADGMRPGSIKELDFGPSEKAVDDAFEFRGIKKGEEPNE